MHPGVGDDSYPLLEGFMAKEFDLRAERERLGLNQYQVSHIIGYARARVQRIEDGIIKPSPGDLDHIRRCLARFEERLADRVEEQAARLQRQAGMAENIQQTSERPEYLGEVGGNEIRSLLKSLRNTNQPINSIDSIPTEAEARYTVSLVKIPDGGFQLELRVAEKEQ